MGVLPQLRLTDRPDTISSSMPNYGEDEAAMVMDVEGGEPRCVYTYM